MDLRLDSSLRFSSVENARVARVSLFPNEYNVSTRSFQLVKMTKEVPKTLYLVLGCRLSGDHGQNVTLSYDT